jgi:hypothetical protein
MKFFREPLVHFLIIGAAIFVLYGLMGQQDVEGVALSVGVQGITIQMVDK